MRKYHLVRRADAKIQRTLIYYAIGILVSLTIGAILLAALGINPFEYYGKMLTIGLIGHRLIIVLQVDIHRLRMAYAETFVFAFNVLVFSCFCFVERSKQ